MELIASIVDFIHGASMVFIVAILLVTMSMSFFLFKMIFGSEGFSSYDRNL